MPYRKKRFQVFQDICFEKVSIQIKESKDDDLIIDLLVGKPWLATYRNADMSLLHIAAAHDRTTIGKVIIDLGCNPNIRSGEPSVHERELSFYPGATPLLVAAKAGASQTCKMLLEEGANINDQSTDGNSALREAAGYNHPDTVTVLLQAGASPNLVCHRWYHMENSCERYTYGSAMHSTDNLAVIKELIAYGGDIDQKDSLGRTPLHNAALFNTPILINQLCSLGATVDERENFREYGYLNNKTPLQLAIRNGNLEAASVLLARGADPNLSSEGSENCLNLRDPDGSENEISFMHRLIERYMNR